MTGDQATSLFADNVLLPSGWHSDVRLEFVGNRIAAIEIGEPARNGDEMHQIVLPGMANVHSHAFQRAMAGLAETRGKGSDSFWTWRDTMYGFAVNMTPDHLEAIAAQLYVEMLEAGFTRVGEFHYLHHDQDGHPYDDIAELAERIAAASQTAGIALTLLPVFYAHSGFGGLPPSLGQRRFINSLDGFAVLLERCREITGRLSGANLGIAPHSLRAVTPQELEAVVSMAPHGPIHIHVAEQVKEVQDCIAWCAARPVEWLLSRAEVNERWCLVHATHMSDTENRDLALSGAVAGLCPITEANLGDGTFDAPRFVGNGGRFGVGSDSNVFISLKAELKQLEYSQRLAKRGRNIIALPGRSNGRFLFDMAMEGGATATCSTAGLIPGGYADFMTLDCSAAHHLKRDQILDNWIFAHDVRVDCVWAQGHKVVAGGRHIYRNTVAERFGKAMIELTEN